MLNSLFRVLTNLGNWDAWHLTQLICKRKVEWIKTKFILFTTPGSATTFTRPGVLGWSADGGDIASGGRPWFYLPTSITGKFVETVLTIRHGFCDPPQVVWLHAMTFIWIHCKALDKSVLGLWMRIIHVVLYQLLKCCGRHTWAVSLDGKVLQVSSPWRKMN